MRLLPAFVEISLAAGDVDQAAAAAAQLAAAAERQESPYLSAAAAFADGQVAATTSHSGHALVRLREALVGWLAIGATYDAARCRVGLALVCRAAGDEETAQLELIAAAAVFAELGAEPDGAMVEQLRQVPDGPARPNGLTAREIEVLRLLATGATNRVIASELFLSEKTVARHVANIFLKLGVSSRSAATAYAFEHRLAGVSSDRRRP